MSESRASALSQDEMLDAAEYVLGTLDHDGRARVERALADNAELQAEIDYWQGRLGVLGLALTPVPPPADVWQAIAARTGLRLDDAAMGAQSRAGSDKVTRLRQKDHAAQSRTARFWPALALAASVAAVAMAALLFNADTSQAPSADAQAAYASVVYDKSTGTSWLVTAPSHPQQFSITAMGRFPLPAGKILRAWLKPADKPPIFLGTWPYTPGEHQLALPAGVADELGQPSQIMVTMEDADVAASDAPNGPLMWASPLGRRTG